MKTIVNIKYEDMYLDKLFSGKEYSYYCEPDVKVGDLVMAPTFYGDKIAKVTRVDIPEDEVKVMKASLLTITRTVDKKQYLKTEGAA